ncbi:unnamed protein product, partial [Ectocarpus sp. 12 AP-2014]
LVSPLASRKYCGSTDNQHKRMKKSIHNHRTPLAEHTTIHTRYNIPTCYTDTISASFFPSMILQSTAISTSSRHVRITTATTMKLLKKTYQQPRQQRRRSSFIITVHSRRVHPDYQGCTVRNLF